MVERGDDIRVEWPEGRKEGRKEVMGICEVEMFLGAWAHKGNEGRRRSDGEGS